MTLSAIQRELEQLRSHPEQSQDTAAEAALLLRKAYELALARGLDFQSVGELVTPAQALLEVNRILAAMPQGDFLNVSQAASLLGVNSSKVLSWIRSGRLRAAITDRPPHTT